MCFGLVVDSLVFSNVVNRRHEIAKESIVDIEEYRKIHETDVCRQVEERLSISVDDSVHSEYNYE